MEPLIRHISDTARWVAVFRARETDRPDALFRDPFARRLAGERGEQIASTMPHGSDNTWAWIMRTYLFDQVIRERIAAGAEMVINLAAGLDARPYRMRSPARFIGWRSICPSCWLIKRRSLPARSPAAIWNASRSTWPTAMRAGPSSGG